MTTRRSQYVGVSTKMYLGYRQSLDWMDGIRAEVLARPALAGAVHTFVAPSYPVLESAQRTFCGTGVSIGAQNCSAGTGALTGEVSAGLLAELGVGLVELGHAERRRLFGEDDAVVAAKLASAVDAGLTPLLCIGEPERTSPQEAAAFCRGQAEAALGSTETDAVIFAYEPVWAIGATEPAPADYVNDVVIRLRALLDQGGGHGTRIIYGGSAGPGLLPQLDAVDGLFLGRFAHKPRNFGLVLDEALARTGGLLP